MHGGWSWLLIYHDWELQSSVPQGLCVPDWHFRRHNREHGPAVPGCTGADWGDPTHPASAGSCCLHTSTGCSAPACSSPREAPWVRRCSRTTSAAAFKSGAVELGVGARGPGMGDPEREITASGDGKCTSPSPGGVPGGKSFVSQKSRQEVVVSVPGSQEGMEIRTDQHRTKLILPFASRQQWAVRERHQRP